MSILRQFLMMESFNEIGANLLNKSFKTTDVRFANIIWDYNFLHINQEYNFNNHPHIIQNFKQSNTIIINYFEVTNTNTIQRMFIIGFEKTIIIVDRNCLPYLLPLFKTKQNSTLFFLSHGKDYFDNELNIQYNEIKEDSQFENNIQLFNQHILLQTPQKGQKYNIWFRIIPCISGYLIQKSIEKNKKDRILSFISNKESGHLCSEIFNEKDFIRLSSIGNGSVFAVYLIYHIEKEELYSIKLANMDFEKVPKLIKREIENYSKMNHPFLPKFIGTVKNRDYFIIEYINGNTLEKISNINLSENEMFTIIFELMIVIEYFHRNKHIYRDLKPDNVMIDENKNIVLIDFDRLICFDNLSKDENFTCDFGSSFHAPELNSGKFSYECDIYSLGYMIKYITNYIKNKPERIIEMYEQCIINNPKKRPSVLKLIFDFYIHFYKKILIKIDQISWYFDNIFGKEISMSIKNYVLDSNNQKHQYKIGRIYNSGPSYLYDLNESNKYFLLSPDESPFMIFINRKIYLNYGIGYFNSKNIEKAIYYFSLAAEMDDPTSQFYLAIIYLNEKYYININKAIKYFTLSAKQNFSKSQYFLGCIYFNGYHVAKDTEKGFYYLKLAADNNHTEAQYNIGFIYESTQYGKFNIKKAIYYYSLAAKNNNSDALYKLGIIYFDGYYFQANKKKGLHYLLLSASLKNDHALFYIGVIYLIGLSVNHNHAKGLTYLFEAVKLKNCYAQFLVGLYYITGLYVKSDVNKGIHLLIQSLDNGYNNIPSHLFLGYIYHVGCYVRRDISRAIHFYKLASSYNVQGAKNNLGVIYADGFEVDKNLSFAIEYFNDGIRQSRDKLCFYNLSHIYFYEEPIENSIEKAIDLLIESFDIDFYALKELLCIALIVQYGFDLIVIKEELDKSSCISEQVLKLIQKENLDDVLVFENKYKHFKDIEFIYDICGFVVPSVFLHEMIFNECTSQTSEQMNTINNDFYEGFGVYIK